MDVERYSPIANVLFFIASAKMAPPCPGASVLPPPFVLFTQYGVPIVYVSFPQQAIIPARTLLLFLGLHASCKWLI